MNALLVDFKAILMANAIQKNGRFKQCRFVSGLFVQHKRLNVPFGAGFQTHRLLDNLGHKIEGAQEGRLAASVLAVNGNSAHGALSGIAGRLKCIGLFQRLIAGCDE